MKIHILHDFREGPWGGGNQFLKSLRRSFEHERVYEDRLERADAVLFNSHQRLREILGLRRAHRDKVFVHRVDGPVSVIRESPPVIDRTIYHFNQRVADGTVFQSEWSRLKNYALGLRRNRFEATILNAPDPEVFNRSGKRPFDRGRRVRLINTSWSAHRGKGFDVYAWLDENLDFSRYEMTFIGRSPMAFRNITWVRPVAGEALAGYLKDHDIFVTASRNDPCSNALIEALHCGLPALALEDGGHPEIVGRGGELFRSAEEIPGRLEKIVGHYSRYQEAIALPGLAETGRAYAAFIRGICGQRDSGGYRPKQLSRSARWNSLAAFYGWKLSQKTDRVRGVLGGGA